MSKENHNEESLRLNRRDFIRLGGGVLAVGAMASAGWGITEIIAGPGDVDTWHKSACRYCGTGCGVMIGMRKNKVLKVRGDQEAHNKGVICIKGSLLADVVNKTETRLLKPKIKKNGKFEEASWEEAMSLVASKFKENIETNGADSVAYYGSGQLYTEESYTANKLFKAGIGTNNVDGNPRLCMASAAVGYTQTFGKDEPPGAYADIDSAEVFFLIGANMYECHPPLWERIMIRKKSNPNVKIIVVDPRRTKTAERADYHLPVIPGTDLLLTNAMAQVIIARGLHDEKFISEHVKFNDGKQDVSFEEYKEFLQDYTPEKVSERLGVSAPQIEEIAYLFASSRATMSLWTMGINQRIQGVFLNNNLNSLHLITQQICRPGATPLSLTGQSNACGGVRDTGSLSHLLPGGRLIANPQHRKEMEEIWGVEPGKIAPKPGYSAVDLFQAMYDDKVKAALVMCTNPAQSAPNADLYREGLDKCFLVVADLYETTETAKYADVLLPAAFYVEKTGVYGQTERRYHLIEKLIDPPGEARSDLSILVDLAERLGYGDLISGKTPNDAWDEWRKVSAKSKYNFEGITYERLKKERGLQWPCPTEDHPGTVRRYMKGDPFVTEGKEIDFYGKPDHKARVFLRPYVESPQQLSEEMPFYLTTGRVIEQWHTGTMTSNAKELNNASGPGRFKLSPYDAQKIGVVDGDMIEVKSGFGSIKGQVEVSNNETPGVIFAAFYDPKFLINKVVSSAYDPVSKEPEYKVTAVNANKVEKIELN
ncbi:nitrate reductase [Flammeovirgaceae bacterium SG7u.111]|nr:nitrate reductase [Flammeovirgaceae bacterium SG7u.132]WPO37654.1 nitrate reductase [Flammeovirgaceae bacterium SG7u.111]